MKQVVFWLLLLSSILLIVTQTSLMTDLFLLLVIGMVPGTEIRVPAWVMMGLYPLIAVTAVYWLSKQPMYIGNSKHNEAVARKIARRKVAKITNTVNEQQQLPTTRRRYRPVKHA
jgi:hypothetical protein